jgi:hypothetical protein
MWTWPCLAQTPAKPATTAHPAPTPEVVDVHAVDPHSYRAVAFRLPAGVAPTIDGRLDDDVWRLAKPFGNFIQREPVVGAPATEPTEFRVLYDDRMLYIAIWAFENHPGGIVASELMRDALLRKGDSVKVVLDTFHDHRNAFYFATNPLGAMKDGFATENGKMNWDWDAVWEVKTTRDEKGWYSEFAIPLGQLRFKEQAGEQLWGFNVGRQVIHTREDSMFVPYPREWLQPGFYRMSGAGLLGGLHDLKPVRRLELIPYLAPNASRDFDAGTPTHVKGGYGMDARVGITQTLNADVTYRTDFAQVEADQEVVNLTRFNLFFPEKRQFFTEGAGTFNYGRLAEEGSAAVADPGLLSLFYSRTIGLSQDGREVPLIGGARLSGNIGQYTIGFMNIETDETEYTAGGRTIRLPKANYTVARLKRNVLRSSTIGVIGLNRQGLIGSDDFNRATGFDGVFTLTDSLKIVGLLAKTFSPGITARDMAGVLDVNWATDRYNATVNHTNIQEAFNAEMGFIPRRDIRRSTMTANWTPRPAWPGVRQLTIGGLSDYIENHDGTPQTRFHDLNFLLTRNDRSSVKVEANRNYDLLPVPFRLGPHVIPVGGYFWNTFTTTVTSDDSRRIFGVGGVDVGGYYNGDKRTFRASVNFLPKPTLLVENQYTRNEITLPGAAKYVTNTVSTRASYSLSPTLFLKAFIQYNDERRLATLNLLLWSIYRPGSDFYVVYNQGWDTNAPGPDTLRPRNRMLAVKVTYWLSR